MSSTDSAADGFTAGNGLPRFVDFVVSSAGVVVLAPVALLIAMAVKIGSRGPVFFKQERVGQGGSRFELLKFRSMRVGTGGSEITAAGDSRVTGIGRFLRWTKLDELPGLWNVVRGDMALVGPRPEVPAFVDLEDPSWLRVLSVRPGLTDPATVELRNEEALLASVENPESFYRQVLQRYKLAAYERYLRGRTAWSDVKVLGLTIMAVFRPVRTPPPSAEEIRGRVEDDHGRQV